MTEQLDFFDELDQPEETEIWVKLLIEYWTPTEPNRKQIAYFEFVDQAPAFEKSITMTQAYHDISVSYNATAWHEDLPDEVEEIEATHDTSITLH